jgi:hypothetical protein
MNAHGPSLATMPGGIAGATVGTLKMPDAP